MPETRGYLSIVDRDVSDQSAWGPGVDLDAIPEADASFEPPRDATAQPEDRTTAQRRWTRELEQRFSRSAALNPDIVDRTDDDVEDFDDVTKDTVITGGKEDAVDEKSYRVRIFNRPTHQGDVSGLEADFALDGAPFNAVDTPNADNRDRDSGWGITVPADDVPGAGAWNNGGAGTVRDDGVRIYQNAGFATADLPNVNSEYDSDYINPDADPEGEEDEV
jgi:hypothetical protein